MFGAKNNVKAILVDLFTPHRGEFTYTYQNNEIAGMKFCCPCGCDKIYFLPFENSKINVKHHWKWNRNQEKPTLSPSINMEDDCKWHGMLIDGEFGWGWHNKEWEKRSEEWRKEWDEKRKKWDEENKEWNKKNKEKDGKKWGWSELFAWWD